MPAKDSLLMQGFGDGLVHYIHTLNTRQPEWRLQEKESDNGRVQGIAG